ncbi:uncharacterized protein LOC111525335 [Piliocolobus tephrosceles]|uniref:uncharacterized protein LOC111525335 n=1 Tax=Piliocolobus tephrosceles TaxID=591936 RepID=UPI000E6B3DF5|nr:uncharacterized protein LOC111525335 [Piliocolobus tephrosceles]
MGGGATEQGIALFREARPCRSPPTASGRPRHGGLQVCSPASHRARQLRPDEISSAAPTGWHCWGPGARSTAAGPGAKPLTAWGRQRQRLLQVRPRELKPTRNLRWPASALRSLGSGPRLSLHTSRQAEGAASGLGQPREELPQCSSGRKGSSSATRVGTEAEEVLRANEGRQHVVTSHHHFGRHR